VELFDCKAQLMVLEGPPLPGKPWPKGNEASRDPYYNQCRMFGLQDKTMLLLLEPHPGESRLWSMLPLLGSTEGSSLLADQWLPWLVTSPACHRLSHWFYGACMTAPSRTALC
jgi:hypothetical protein